MKPLIWSSPENFPQRHYAIATADFHEVSFKLKLAQPALSTIHPAFTIEAPMAKLEKWDVVLNNVGLPLVRRAALELFREVASGDTEFLPTKVTFQDQENFDFVTLNITRLVQGIDMERSEHKTSDLGVISFRKTYLRDDCMEGAAIARDSTFEPLKLVAPWMKEEIEKRKIKGVKLYNVVEAGYAPDE